jgi:hypothetical protein
MPLGNPPGGASFAAEFQSSALPWMTSSIVTSSPQEWDFAMVTRFVTVVNSGSGSLKLGVTSLGVQGTNYVTVPGATQLTLEWRCTKVFIAGTVGVPYSLAVGLTTIPAGNFPNLTGSFPDGTNWPGVG